MTTPTFYIPPASEIKFKHLYWVSQNDSKRPLNIFAVAPSLRANGTIEWGDTSRGAWVIPRGVLVDGVEYEKRLNDDPKTIVISLGNNEKITLQYVTIDIYNEKLKEICEGQPSFKDTEELQKFYLTHF